MNDMRSSHDPHVWPPLAAATNDMIEFDHMLLALLPFLMVPNNDCSDTATVTAESSSLHDSRREHDPSTRLAGLVVATYGRPFRNLRFLHLADAL